MTAPIPSRCAQANLHALVGINKVNVYPNDAATHIQAVFLQLKGYALEQEVVSSLETLEDRFKAKGQKAHRWVRYFLSKSTTFPFYRLVPDLQRKIVSLLGVYEFAKFYTNINRPKPVLTAILIDQVNNEKKDFPHYYFPKDDISHCLEPLKERLNFLSLHDPIPDLIHSFFVCSNITHLRIHTRDLKECQIRTLCFTNWPHLQEVWLGQSWEVCAASYIALAQKISSTTFHTFRFETLAWGSVHPKELYSLPCMRTLTTLSLHRMHITDGMLVELTSLFDFTLLEEIDLQCNDLTSESVNSVIIMMTSLRSLRLAFNKLKEIDTVKICYHSNLSNLIAFDLYDENFAVHRQSPFAARIRKK